MGVIHVAAWRAAYAGVMPAQFLDRLDPTERAAYWHDALTRSPGERTRPGPTTLVADLDGAVVAMASFGGFRDGAEGDPTGELWMLNAHPDAFGTGVGAALDDAAVAALVADGHASAALWVVDRNARARRFYERQGWAPDGVVKKDDVGGMAITELRYVRSLAASA